MTRKLFIPFLLLLALSLTFLDVPLKVQATTLNESKVFYASTYSTDAYQTNTVYNIARIAPSGLLSWYANYEYIGGQQHVAFPSYTYFVWRSFLIFDTSTLPNDVSMNVTSATLSLMFYTDSSATDFNLTIQSGLPNYPSVPPISTDYYYGHYAGSYGNLDTTGKSVNTYYNITMSNSSLVTLGGYTKLCLRSSRDIEALSPIGSEMVAIYGYAWGYTKTPRLYVSYTVSGCRYIFHAPYYENGALANVTLSCVLYRTAEAPYSFTLSMNGTQEGNLTYYTSAIPISLTWNLTTSLNQTRIYYFTEENEELWLFIPNGSSQLYYLYTVNFIALTTVSNPFLETHMNVNGQDRIVERQKISTTTSIPFWLVMFHPYSFRVVCDEGSHDYGMFTAATDYTFYLSALAGYFPKASTTTNVTASAARINTTWIQANYSDNQYETSWCAITISVYVGMNTYSSVYSYNSSGSAHQINYYDASATSDYRVYIQAERTNGQVRYSFILASTNITATSENPFEALFTFFSDAPFPLKYGMGLFLVFFFLCIFSYYNLVAGCFSAWAIACLLTLIHWLDIAYGLLGFAGAICFLIAFIDFRQKERLKGSDI